MKPIHQCLYQLLEITYRLSSPHISNNVVDLLVRLFEHPHTNYQVLSLFSILNDLGLRSWHLRIELEAKSIAGEGNARLNRRMKRKQDREIAEIVSKGLPPLPTPTPLPDVSVTEAQPSLPVAELDPGALPPLADLPPLRRQAVCPSCSANFPVTDLMRAQVTCPICSERFNL